MNEIRGRVHHGDGCPRHAWGCSGPSRSHMKWRRDEPTSLSWLPVEFGAWDIQGPKNFGILSSLADRGTAESLLILRPGGTPSSSSPS